MMVYACNDDKKLVKVYVPNEQIVAAGIDPFRFDLCDNNPIIRNTEFGPLKFMRLKNIAFLYELEQTVVTVAIKYEDRTLCLTSRNYSEHSTLTGSILRSVAVSKRTFDQHLLEFLSQGNIGGHYYTPAYMRRIRCEQHGVFPSSAIQIRGSDVLVSDTPLGKNYPSPTGKMLETVGMPMVLPEEINLITRTLMPLKPAVVGPAIVAAIAGKPVDEVVVFLNAQSDKEWMDLIKPHYPDASLDVVTSNTIGLASSVKINGCTYLMKAHFNGNPAQLLECDEFPKAYVEPESFNFANLLCSMSENEICACRIIHHLAGMQMSRSLASEGLRDVKLRGLY